MMNDDLSNIMMEYQYMPLRDVVFHTLRRAIMEGELKPGERLMEIKLANRLGVSRTPIREAIRMLEQEGLVVMAPRKGAQVAKITEKDLNDVMEVRKGLEALAARFACERITEEALEEMEKISSRFSKALEENDLNALAEADVDFHEIIYQATGNIRLVQLIHNMSEQMFRYRIEYLKQEETRESIVMDHTELWQKLKNRDEAGAISCLEAHIDKQWKYILKLLDSMKGQTDDE